MGRAVEMENSDWCAFLGGSISTIDGVHGDTFDDGHVRTQYGYVQAAASNDYTGLTRLWFIWYGREYQRTFYKRYSKRHMVTLSHKFAADIAEGRR